PEHRIGLDIVFALGVLLWSFIEPVRLVLIIFSDSMIELARDAADGFLVASVGSAQSPAGHAAKVFARLDKDNAFPHASGLDSGDNASAGAAVDDDVVGFLGPRGDAEGCE